MHHRPRPVRHRPQAGARRSRLASLLAIAGFTVLGSVFEYPQILEEPTARHPRPLPRARGHRHRPGSCVLVVSAALMAPAGIWLGRLAGGTLGRWIAASAWPPPRSRSSACSAGSPWSPGISQDALDPARRAAAEDRFELLAHRAGQGVGETVGYALTATFTVLVVIGAPASGCCPRWLAVVGYLAAAADRDRRGDPAGGGRRLTNFAGYVAVVRLAARPGGPPDRSPSGSRNHPAGPVPLSCAAPASNARLDRQHQGMTNAPGRTRSPMGHRPPCPRRGQHHPDDPCPGLAVAEASSSSARSPTRVTTSPRPGWRSSASVGTSSPGSRPG